MRLFELGKGKAIASSVEFPVLFHLCDYIGFSFAMERDVLRSHSHYVSTTWNPKMNHVVGKDFALFKLVLDGKIIDEYGAFHYDDYATEIGTNRKVSHGEDEIGIDTKEIKPLSEYHRGTVLMFDLFTESGLQWLLYKNSGRKDSFFSGPAADATRQAIDTIFDHLYVLKKPLWKQRVGKGLSREEMRYLRAVHEVKDLPFTKALEAIAGQFSITDHWNKPVDQRTYERRHMAPQMVEMLNSYYQKRKYSDVDLKVVRAMIEKCINMLDLGDNAEKTIMHEIDTSGLLHETTAPVEWGIVLKTAMDGDVDAVLETINWIAERNRNNRQWWELTGGRDTVGTPSHVGTSFGR